MAIKAETLTQQLIAAIQKAEKKGITRYQIAKTSGISQAQLSRMMKETNIPKVDTLEKIVEALGLKIVLTSRKK